MLQPLPEPAGARGAGAATVPTIVAKVIYWLAVLLISLALLVALVLFFESRDESALDAGTLLHGLPVGALL